MTGWTNKGNLVIDPIGNIICEAREVPATDKDPECSAEFMAELIAEVITIFYCEHIQES